MLARCSNPKNEKYPRYGGRGVRVCRRWAGDFAAFLADVGERPGAGYSIDRINNDGHYSCGKCEECRANGWPTNVRWATPVVQARNTSTVLRLLFRGECLPLTEWAQRTGIPARTLYQRLREDEWPVEKALTQPYRKPTGKTTATVLLYVTWRNMQKRCYDPGHQKYPRYGGRGITVCVRWRESLEAFRGDMGAKPARKHSIDRIDNAGGYWCGKSECPECGPLKRKPNCRWATPTEQAANK